MKLFDVGDPSAVTGRTWAIGMDPPALHARACECLRWRKDTGITGLKVVDSSIAIDPPAPLFGVVSDVLEEVRKPGYLLTLPRAVELLERLTIHLSFRIILPRPTHSSQPDTRAAKNTGAAAVEVRVDRALSAKDLQVSDLTPGDTFAARWERWCLESGRPLLELLDEYELVRGQLETLTASEARLSYILRRLVGGGGWISLGTWSCQLPRGWQTQCNPDWAPSQWAEFLLSKKHGSNTRQVKEQLRDARVERQIRDAWDAYGRWLLAHQVPLREVGVLLGVPITGGLGDPELVTPRSAKKVTSENQ